MLDWENLESWCVVIIDDEPDNLDLVVETLTVYRVTVHSSNDGEKGIEIVKTVNTNLILLDLSMPDVDGWEVHRRIREMPAMSTVPIVAMTAHAMVGDKERVMAAGFDGYMTKPIRVPNLVNDIRAAIEESNHDEASNDSP
jgi:CheY-like chemotaxis protein